MTSADKLGMAVAVGVVAVFLGFTMTGGSGSPSDIPETVAPVMEEAEVIREDLETKAEKIKDVAEETKEILEETAEKMEETREVVEEGVQMAEEIVSPKASVRLVSIPTGTAVPGCEEEDFCYDPPHLIIFTDTEVTWKNDDTAAHTVSSGSPSEGPDGIFDSSLILGGATYSFKFEEKGDYPYFCMVHPWMVGTVSVE